MNIRRKINILAAALLAVACVGVVRADDDSFDEGPRQIRGDYRVVINQTCVRTPFQPPPANGFDAATKELKAQGEPLTAIGTGLLRFQNDGTLQLLEGKQTEVSFSQITVGQTPVTPPADFTCTGEYSLDGRKMTMTLACEVQVPDPSLKVTVGPQHFEGYLDRNRKTISVTNIAGGVQTITVAAFGNPVQQRQRVCTQHALAAR